MGDVLNYDTLAWDDVAEGDALPALTREITATLVAVGAVSASRDVYPVHHDAAAARAAGAPDVFMNILTTNGLMAAFVTNWCGHGWDLVDLSLKLMVPNYPGDTMTTTGAVTRKWTDGGRRHLAVAFRGANSTGPHCQGTATIVEAGG